MQRFEVFHTEVQKTTLVGCGFSQTALERWSLSRSNRVAQPMGIQTWLAWKFLEVDENPDCWWLNHVKSPFAHEIPEKIHQMPLNYIKSLLLIFVHWNPINDYLPIYITSIFLLFIPVYQWNFYLYQYISQRKAPQLLPSRQPFWRPSTRWQRRQHWGKHGAFLYKGRLVGSLCDRSLGRYSVIPRSLMGTELHIFQYINFIIICKYAFAFRILD
jgi:hypothetical protein